MHCGHYNNVMKQSQSFKVVIICNYNCTIKGLELNVVLEEKLHGLDILSPDKLSLLFFNRKPFQLKTLSA